MSDLKSDVAVLKADVSTLKSDVSELKSVVSKLKTDMSALRVDITKFKCEIRSDMDEFKDSIKGDMSDLGAEVQGGMAAMEGRLHAHVNRHAWMTVSVIATLMVDSVGLTGYFVKILAQPAGWLSSSGGDLKIDMADFKGERRSGMTSLAKRATGKPVMVLALSRHEKWIDRP